MFSHLALTLLNKTISVSAVSDSGSQPTGRSSSSRASNIPAIVGGSIGGLAVIAVLFVIAFLFLQKRRRQSRRHQEQAQNLKSEVVARQLPTRRPTPFTYSQMATVGSGDGSDPPAGRLDMEGANRRRAVPPSSKPVDRERPSPPPVVALSGVDEGMGMGSRTESAADGNSLPMAEVQGLRTEVENLRRVMQQFHIQRLEAPPEYEV